MEQIPVEVLEMIFDRVPVGQLDECRRVCKFWQWTIDHLVFDCLVVYLDCPPVNQTLFPTNRRLSLRYCVQMEEFIYMEQFINLAELKKSIYCKFKRICFYDQLQNYAFPTVFRGLGSHWIEAPGIYLEQVQMVTYHLSQLEELHLWHVRVDPSNRTLVLPNVKTFKIIPRIGPDFILDAPHLRNLSITSYEHFRLVHPETVETLEVLPYNITSIFLNEYNFLTSLTSLKRLLFFGETGYSLWRGGMMEFLSGLEEIHVLSFNFCKKFYEGMQELKVRAKKLSIYFGGLEIDALRDLLSTITKDTHHKYFCSGILKTSDQRDFYEANYAALSETPQIYGVDYSLIEPLIGAHLFPPQRLSMLKTVIVKGSVRDEPAFGWWLSKLNSLIEIHFLCSLSQEFYSNILPASCPTLPCLTLDFGTPLDFSFLFKLKFLYQLDLATADYDLVKRLFENLVYLRKLALEEYKYNFPWGNPSKQSLGVVKKRKEKKMAFEVYDGNHEDAGRKHNRWFKLVQEFENFKSLLEFLSMDSPNFIHSYDYNCNLDNFGHPNWSRIRDQ